MRGTFLLAVALAAIVAGCGGGSGGTTSSAPATTRAATTVPRVAGFATPANCRKMAQIGATFAQAAQAASGGGRQALGDEAKALEAMAAAAPAEIRGDFATIAGALGDYAKVWDKLSLAPGEAPSAAQIAQLVAAAQRLATSEVQEASQHVSTWVAKNCGAKGPTSD